MMCQPLSSRHIDIDAMMKEFLSYFSSCGLSMNPSKSELIVLEEGTHTKLLRVTVQKGYSFQKHATMVAGTVRTKVENLTKVITMMEHKVDKRVTQKAMNCAVRMLIPGGRGHSMTDGLALL